MKLMKWMPVLIVFSLMVIFVSGCKNNDNSMVGAQNSQITPDANATLDALYSISANVAIDNSGVLEEMSDVLQTASLAGIVNEDDNSMLNFGNNHRDVTKQYDSTTGWWTITVTRHRGNMLGFYYADYSRVYQDQFLNKNGQFQKFYIVPDGSAFIRISLIIRLLVVLEFLKLPKSPTIDRIVGVWNVTEPTPIVTLNSTSPYVRSVSDTVTEMEQSWHFKRNPDP